MIRLCCDLSGQVIGRKGAYWLLVVAVLGYGSCKTSREGCNSAEQQ